MKLIFKHGCVISGVLFSVQLLTSSVVFATPANTKTLNTLSTLLSELERKHPQLKVSRAEIGAAKSRTRAASQPIYNPEIGLDSERVGFNRNKTDTIVFGINQTVDWYDKRSARKNIATIGQQAVQFEQQTIRQQLIADIFSALADYHLQREVIRAHQKRLTIAKQGLAQATRLYKAGDISKLDLEQIRLSQTQTELTLNRSKTSLVEKAHALSAIAGVNRKAWPALPSSPPYLVPSKLDYDAISENLPTIKARAIGVAKARSIMRLRVREQKADPTFGVSAGGESGDKIIGFSVSIPLNVRNTYQAEVDEARSDIRRAESLLENYKHLSKTSLRSAVKSYQLTYSSWKSWQKIASASLKKQSHLLMRLWKAGELSTSDYLVQLNQIKEAELNDVELKGNVWKAWFNWLAKSNQFEKWLNGSLKNIK